MHQYNGGFGTPFGTTECHHNTWDKNVVWNAYDHNGDGNGLQIDQSCHDNNVTKNLFFGNDGLGISIYDSNNNRISENVTFNNGVSNPSQSPPQNFYYIWSSATGGSNQAVWNGASPGGDTGIIHSSAAEGGFEMASRPSGLTDDSDIR
jgi:parallel beta-helix repeat protein